MAFIVVPKLIMSCTCATYNEPFCATIKSDYYIINSVVIDDTDEAGITVQVIEEFNLNEISDTINVAGIYSAICGVYMEQFTVGDTLIMAIVPKLYTNTNTGTEYQWYLDRCNTQFLKIINGEVTGNIDFNISTQSYFDFKNDFDKCLDDSVSNEEINESRLGIKFYPNPAYNYIAIDPGNLKIKSIKIIGTNGIVFKSITFNEDKSISIDLTGLNNGIFFIEVKSDEIIFLEKLLKI